MGGWRVEGGVDSLGWVSGRIEGMRGAGS